MRVLLRCDAGGPTGVGHLVRSVALGVEAVRRGHEVTLAGTYTGPVADEVLGASGLDIAPGGPLARLAAEHGSQVLHIDGYDVAADGAAPGVLMSRMHDGPYGAHPAGLLIDPTPGAEDRAEPRALGPGGLRLRGARWLPLRAEVLAQREQSVRRAHGSGAGRLRVTVVMGGTDPLGLELLVRRALADVAGPGLVVRGPGPGLIEALAGSDLVVTAAGTTMWEVAALGVPMAVVAAVDNQRPGYDYVVRAEAGLGLGTASEVADVRRTAGVLGRLLVDADERARLAAAAAQIVDGLGTWRLVGVWEQLTGEDAPAASPSVPGLALRAATRGDAASLFAWRNDTVTRAWSRTGGPVSWTEHLAWLESSLVRTDRLLLVAEDARGAVGTVRWDDEGSGEWEVSVTLAPPRRGSGLAGSLLRAGEDELLRWAASHGRRVTAYRAWIHRDNVASRRLFSRAAYLPEQPSDGAGFALVRRESAAGHGPPSM